MQEDQDSQKVILNNRHTYQQIFNDMYESLCAFVHRFDANQSICEDCVQEAFISLWEYRDKIETLTHARAFLYQVSRNNILNHLKHECIKNKCILDKSLHHTLLSDWMDCVIEEEVERVLRQTHEELPPKCRHILTLDLQGKSTSEIALLLGISENTVKTQKRLAHKRLKDNISELFTLLLLISESFL